MAAFRIRAATLRCEECRYDVCCTGEFRNKQESDVPVPAAWTELTGARSVTNPQDGQGPRSMNQRQRCRPITSVNRSQCKDEQRDGINYLCYVEDVERSMRWSAAAASPLLIRDSQRSSLPSTTLSTPKTPTTTNIHHGPNPTTNARHAQRRHVRHQRLPTPDCAEKVHVSSLALLKMLKHGRAGVPMEVMGLMLGQFVDEYTINCVDVFAMPQSGTSVSVEAVDPVFQTKMLDMLQQTGRGEMVVGWYHSHPGFGCWLSSTDINTQSSFEALNARAVALVVDPIQSVKGKVVIDCFRLINPQLMMMGQEPRQTTSNIGHLNKPSIQALIHGLNRHYYSIVIDYRKNELEEQMLMNLHKRNWTAGLTVEKFEEHREKNESIVDRMLKLTQDYNERIVQEEGKTAEEVMVENVGKIDPKKHLEGCVAELMSRNIIQCLGTMLDTVVF
ncbi:hypothetical protein HJC23_003114 [Cyclotella cryptica]|uniref:MPN domain-containing protein n=1 Tax=Cyclotella cryptica TaxID=29204 RepID=A0ABD3NY94_9STRA